MTDEEKLKELINELDTWGKDKSDPEFLKLLVTIWNLGAKIKYAANL